MKKEILVAIGIAGALCSGAPASLSAQEKLSLEQCREMALKYNKDMAAANKRTEAARLNRHLQHGGRKSGNSGRKPSRFLA